MARAAKKSARAAGRKLSLATSGGRRVDLDKLRIDEEAQLEYEQNKPRINQNLKPRNENQAIYLSHMETGRVTFGLGPAGVGKTFVSTLWACQQFDKKAIDRIIVTRPMVGCDEDIGAVPGTELEKFIGWAGPVLEVLEGYFGKSKVATLMKFDKIVLKPLMMLRGSTFRNAIAILDEAQNTTRGQMKMFLTRVGEGTKLVINGDLEQTDLPAHIENGLEEATKLFSNSRNINFVTFTEDDIVRDPLVREIVKAYRKK